MPRYRDIYETLKGEIRTGKFGVGCSFPSERALMRRFSVARETVRHAIDELRKQSLLESRQGTMNVLAFRARERAAGTFGMIVPDSSYPFYTRICSGIERAAKRAGGGSGFGLLSVDLGFGERSLQIERALDFADVCVREKVSGVFFQPLQLTRGVDRANHVILSRLTRAGIPVVLLDSDIVPPPRRSKFDLVGVDNIAIGYDIGEHLIGRGAKRIVFLLQPYPAPTSLLRGYGISLAVTEAGLPWTDKNVVFADPKDPSTVRKVMGGRKRTEAVAVANDYAASLFLENLKAHGMRVPEDVMLVGVNGDPLAETADPPITTAVQPCEQIGELAVQLMLERISNPNLPRRSILLDAPLIIRKSSQKTKKRQKKG